MAYRRQRIGRDTVIYFSGDVEIWLQYTLRILVCACIHTYTLHTIHTHICRLFQTTVVDCTCCGFAHFMFCFEAGRGRTTLRQQNIVVLYTVCRTQNMNRFHAVGIIDRKFGQNDVEVWGVFIPPRSMLHQPLYHLSPYIFFLSRTTVSTASPLKNSHVPETSTSRPHGLVRRAQQTANCRGGRFYIVEAHTLG